MRKRFLHGIFIVLGVCVGLLLFVLLISTQAGPPTPFIYEAF